MSLIDLFLDQDAESDRIRRLSRKIATRPKKDKANAALKRTRDDVGFLALALLAAIKLLEEKGVFNEEEFMTRIIGLDTLDGLADGKIDPEQLRRALGLGAGGRVTRRARRKPRPGKPPEARLVDPAREPHPKGLKRKVVRNQRKSRSKTLAWTEPEPASVEAPQVAVPAAPAPSPAPPAEPVDISSLELDIPDTSMDPAALGDINFDDYYGGGKKE